MSDHHPKIENLHAQWLDEMAKLAWRHGNASKPRSEAHLWRIALEDEFILEHVGSFGLPNGSAAMCVEMAFFAHATLSDPDEIRGIDLDQVPEPTFCLHSLLWAAFPKNIDTDVFKGNDCAISVADLPDEGQFRSAHAAFGGLGVILMENCRRFIEPLAPDAEILKLSDGMFISVVDLEA
jgi:hypothetical protein